MHPWRAFIVLALFAPLATPAAVVYKWTDADGVVHFSDQPQAGAEKVPLTPAPKHGTPADTRRPAATRPQTQDAPKKPVLQLGYTDVSVVAPASGRTYVDEPVRVSLSLSPDLQPGHGLVWYLNGSPLGETETAFVIDHLDRGAYSLYATITDTATGETASSNSVTFYVRQPSLLAPQNPNPKK